MRIVVEIICGRPGRDPFGTARVDERSEIDVSFNPPDLTLSIGRAVGGELEAVGKQREERLAAIGLVRERCTHVGELRSRRRLDLLHELGQLRGRLLRRQDLRFELLDTRRALAQLRHQLGDIVGERDRLRKSLLLRAHVAQLLFECRDVRLALGQLSLDLLADLREHFVEHAFRQHVARDVLDERAFDVVHALVHGNNDAPQSGFLGGSGETNADCTPGDCDGRPDPNGPSRTVHIVWTIGHQPASAATCANSPHYAAELQTDPAGYRATDMVLYPVPCAEGKLTIADVPARYWIGGMQTSLTGDRAGAAAPFDQTTQTATIDMMPW